ncbi:MAG: hypothetical protein LBI68_10955 [Azoarcus sp.]|jgi:hypothetical protein|nr:hypothetical protein [Azoarcus sp.]
MKRFFWLALLSLLIAAPAHANGRQPCDRGAGGIARCEGAKFRCNDGRISRSKKICDPTAVHGYAPAAAGKTSRKKSKK